jgi:hypothetical protein
MTEIRKELRYIIKDDDDEPGIIFKVMKLYRKKILEVIDKAL